MSLNLAVQKHWFSYDAKLGATNNKGYLKLQSWVIQKPWFSYDLKRGATKNNGFTCSLAWRCKNIGLRYNNVGFL